MLSSVKFSFASGKFRAGLELKSYGKESLMKLLGVRDPGGRSRGKEKRRGKENEKSRKR